MKLFINNEEVNKIPYIRFKPKKHVLIDRLYGFNLDYSFKVELQPVYKPILIVVKTNNKIRLELFGYGINLMPKKPFITEEDL